MNNIDKILADIQKDIGERAFLASEAPPVKVLSTGIVSLDVATGVGGYPRGTLVEIYGRESVGKTALTLYAMAEVHKQNGFTALVNLESNVTQEGWVRWATRIAPPGFDPKRLLIVNARPDSESVVLFGKLIASGGFDMVVYDSIGAMSTDNELRVGQSKQAYGQSALVTQLAKQVSWHGYTTQCVPVVLNQIRDDLAGTYIIEKPPGGRAKGHMASLRIHLKPSEYDFKKTVPGGTGKVDGEDIVMGFRVGATLVKNKVGSPRRKAAWNFWNYPSPDGVVGIDVLQDAIDTALKLNMFAKAGSWYKHDEFPEGRLHGGASVAAYLKENPDFMENIRREMVMKVYNNEGNIMEEREVLTDEN